MPVGLSWVPACGVSQHQRVSSWRPVWANRCFLAVQVGQQSPRDMRLDCSRDIRLDCSRHAWPCAQGSRVAAEPWPPVSCPLVLPDIGPQVQRFPASALQAGETVAEPESLKKLLIIWLMCIRLWGCEINHQPWDELLKWILVFCLLSLGNGFSFLHHQVSRCKDAVFSFSQSQ